MAKSSVIKALAKVLVAAAWADGSVSREEINSLKDLLFQLPEMTASDWAEVDIFIETPVDSAERARLVAELQSAITRSRHKKLALEAIDKLVSADGEVTEEERVVASEIKAAIQEAGVGVFGALGNLVGNSISRRFQALESSPNREHFMDDYIKNKVYYLVSRRLEIEDTEIELSEEELRKLSLAGGLMARVAYVDREVHEGEFDAMVKAIRENWEVSDFKSALVAEIAVSAVTRGLDYHRMSRQFFESTSEAERVKFLDVLFAVADGDGTVTQMEIEEIRTIATVLKLSHRQFIDAKLKIPRERRAN
ncbi:MAG: TerB family tellurite resistance protein [Anaerolineales bacterium]